MEQLLKNFIFTSTGPEGLCSICALPYLKVGINRLLYPKGCQKHIQNKNEQKTEYSFISDDDRLDETVMSFCELVLFFYGFLYLLDDAIRNALRTDESYIISAINRRFKNLRNKKFASFQEVHEFFVNIAYEDADFRILKYFNFSNESIIELLELFSQDISVANATKKEEDEDKDYKKNIAGDRYIESFTEESHRHFEELIKRENYPPLFFAVLVYNSINKSLLVDKFNFSPVFSKAVKIELDTLFIDDHRSRFYDDMILDDDDLQELFQNNHYFSDCKFTGWVDEWLENFNSFVEKDEFLELISVDFDFEDDEDDDDGSNGFSEWFDDSIQDIILRNLGNTGKSDSHLDDNCSLGSSLLLPAVVDEVFLFLRTRGWKIPSHYNRDRKIDTRFQRVWIGLSLKRMAAAYSIIQDVLSDESKTTINWWLGRTHYFTIFNKLVEYYSAAYIDNGQRQIPLQDVESSAVKKSNDDEQQNIPVIVIDKDEAHKKWFVRVHEKKINAQPDEWNKKLYTCLDALYESLVKNRLMCESSKKELFIYRFSGFNIPEPFNPLEKIKWEGENVLLGYLVRCLITYTGTGAKDLGTAGTFFIGKSGNEVNLATAKYISKERFNHTPNMFPNLKHAVEILKECGFDEVEVTSTRTRDK